MIAPRFGKFATEIYPSDSSVYLRCGNACCDGMCARLGVNGTMSRVIQKGLLFPPIMFAILSVQMRENRWL